MDRFAAALLAVLLAPVALAGQRTWDEAYLDAIEALESGNFEIAVGALNESVATRPEPSLAAVDTRIDYLPYINLAAAYYELGNKEAAREALDKSYHHRVATRSYVGSRIWDQYALKIMASDEQTLAASAESDFREFERSDLTLTPLEAERIKNEVLRRCALTGQGPSDILPWYFHYEYGLELMQAGDPQRAVDELILAANKREESRRNSRMYGMWFTNYLPYFQIALAHSKLGNWRCALDAMRISAQYGEFSPVDPGFQEYSDLQKLIMLENEKSG